MSVGQYRDINIEIRMKIAGQDWHGNCMDSRDVLAEINKALDTSVKIQRYQVVKVTFEKEGQNGEE